MKGEFERRLQGVIDEVKGSAKPIILFIDEAHTLIGAGGQAGSGDAANLLPALARGELRTIAATTWSEYKKYFEKDPALARRFQPVQLHEPSVPEAVTILRGLAPVTKRVTASTCAMMRSRPPPSCRHATWPAGSCRTRPSTCWIPPARGCASASPLRPRRWNACVVRSPKASASVKPCAAILPPACRSTRLSSSDWSNVCSRRGRNRAARIPLDQAAPARRAPARAAQTHRRSPQRCKRGRRGPIAR